MRASDLIASVILGCVASPCVSCSNSSAQASAQDAGEPERAYPDGPFGTTQDSVIADADFVGFVDPARGIGESQRVPFGLADFYNPSGEGQYAENSPFGYERTLPRALLVVVAGLWCGASRLEGSEVLPQRHSLYRPLGAEFLVVLAEGVPAGEAAAANDLDLWISTVVQAEHPTAIEPSGGLREGFGPGNYPDNMVVDTRDMSIVAVDYGAPDDTFWTKLEELLGAAQ